AIGLWLARQRLPNTLAFQVDLFGRKQPQLSNDAARQHTRSDWSMDVRGRTIAQRTSSRRILLLRSEHDFRIAEPVERRKQLLFDRNHLLDDFMPCSLADRTFRQL